MYVFFARDYLKKQVKVSQNKNLHALLDLMLDFVGFKIQ